MIGWNENLRTLGPPRHTIGRRWPAALLGVSQELVQGVLVVLQAGHGHQEALDDLPGLAAVVRLSIGALQAVQRGLNSLQCRTFLIPSTTGII